MDGSTWFRFVGSAGSVLPTRPRSVNNNAPCGASNVGWMKGRHPSESDGIVSRTVCFSANAQQCFSDGFVDFKYSTNVAACKEQDGQLFYVYQLKKPTNCDWGGFGYCAE